MDLGGIVPLCDQIAMALRASLAPDYEPTPMSSSASSSSVPPKNEKTEVIEKAPEKTEDEKKEVIDKAPKETEEKNELPDDSLLSQRQRTLLKTGRARKRGGLRQEWHERNCYVPDSDEWCQKKKEFQRKRTKKVLELQAKNK